MQSFGVIHERDFKLSMEMSSLLCPLIAQSSGRFKNGVFPDKQWLPRASYYIHHFEKTQYGTLF